MTGTDASVELDIATPEAKKFIKELNQKIKYYENTMATRAGKKEDKPEGGNDALPEEE